jgi:hypothetical protein
MKKFSLALSLLIVFISTTAMAAAPIRIGALFAVTGPASFLGEPEKNTLELLVKEINAKGGVKGSKIELVVYDTQGDATKAREKLGWTARISFEELVREMVEADLQEIAADADGRQRLARPRQLSPKRVKRA